MGWRFGALPTRVRDGGLRVVIRSGRRGLYVYKCGNPSDWEENQSKVWLRLGCQNA